jgi:hypothetical protein
METIKYRQEWLRIVRYYKNLGITVHTNGKTFTMHIPNTGPGGYSEHKQLIVGKMDERFY